MQTRGVRSTSSLPPSPQILIYAALISKLKFAVRSGVSYRSLPIGRIQRVVETHVAEPLPDSDYEPLEGAAEDLRRSAKIGGKNS